MSNSSTPVVLAINQIAERWRLDPATIRAMLRDGILKGFKVGTGGPRANWRVLLSEVERYEREGAANA